MSIRPGLSKAGSNFSMWFVVKIIMRSFPQQDHSPSVKFKSPERVTLLPRDDAACLDDVGFNFPTGFSTRAPVRSREQSTSSMTIIDLLVVFVSRALSMLLSYTW